MRGLKAKMLRQAAKAMSVKDWTLYDKVGMHQKIVKVPFALSPTGIMPVDVPNPITLAEGCGRKLYRRMKSNG